MATVGTRTAPGRARRTQSGFTLVEMLIATMMLGLIGAMCVAAFMSGSQALGRVDDDSRGQADQRNLVERMTQDLRQARGIDPGATSAKLSVWIDYDADFARDANETVTWALSATANSSGHHDVVRTINGKNETIGRAVVSDIAFTYKRIAGTLTMDTAPNLPDTTATPNVPVTDANVVLVRMEYDAIVNGYLQKKVTTVDSRLRNTQ